MICLAALLVQAQRCAVLEFKAGVGISQADVDGISAIFITYFRPDGYTMVERTQIDRVIAEQGFQRSNMTQSQMVRIGQILNVSKIVVGDINVVMGQYNVDTRVINVETGTIVATEGASFTSSSYRSSMQSVAEKLADKIAITHSNTGQSQGQYQVINGYVDLGLPSGTLWKAKNENGRYDYNAAMQEFGGDIPDQEQWLELKEYCSWKWNDAGFRIVGQNGNSIFLPAINSSGMSCYFYWSSVPIDSEQALCFYFCRPELDLLFHVTKRATPLPIRLVHNK